MWHNTQDNLSPFLSVRTDFDSAFASAIMRIVHGIEVAGEDERYVHAVEGGVTAFDVACSWVRSSWRPFLELVSWR